MKKIPLLFISILSFQFFLTIGKQAFSQGGVWTWVSGSNLLADNGIYGTQGIPSINNRPPANYEYVEWKDDAGNFWIYGGTFPPLSDLWKFNPQTLEWTWVKGNALSSQPAVYGTQGISDPQNTPGPRAYGAVTWTDTSGNLWLFGGDASNGLLNDIWKYDISINEWTWMKGDTIGFALGNHGIQGVPGPNVIPGARCETAIGWIDSFNNLWIFGGTGMDDVGVGFGPLNDVMEYDIISNEWTWMNGSNLGGVAPVWGIKNIPSVLNDPGARCSYSHWTDIQGGFWLMGGIYGFSTTSFFLNDVWRLDPNTNTWTWKAGTDTFNDTGNYQSICAFNSLNNPYSRLENRSGVQDNCGRHWFYGGTNGVDTDFVMNDLWIFDPYILDYAWMWGDNFPNPLYTFGTLGVPSSTNNPPCRTGPATWWGNDNRFYMFGGLYAVLPGPNWVSMNDMWVFTPDSLCIGACQALASAAINSDSICPGTCIDFINLSTYATSFQWFFPGANPSSSTSANPEICYASPGNYDVTLIAANATNADTLVLSNYITVLPQPSPQSITQFGDTLFAIAGSAMYQWYLNGNIITGATNYFYVATASGDYNVVTTDNNGCEVEAVINNVIANTWLEVSGLRFEVFPNPVTEDLYFYSHVLFGTGEAKLCVFNLIGEKIYSDNYFHPDKFGECSLNCQSFPAGLYFLEINSDNKTSRAKFIKQ